MPTPRSQLAAESDEAPASEDFWPVLEERVREQISDLDREIEQLYRERDRLQNFLNDHNR